VGAFCGGFLIKTFLSTICILVCATQVLAETKEKPVSVSYTNILKCFPALKNDSQSLKVDLNQLKEDVDKNYVTSQSLLRYRQVLLKDSSGQQKRLKLSAKPIKKGKVNYLLSVEKLDSKGAGTPQEIPLAQRTNPSQKELDQYFLNQDVVEDERSYFDTKLNGQTLSFKRGFQKIFELELSDEKAHQRLLCEDKNGLGVVCTCFQK
jgi:hypothetical protein